MKKTKITSIADQEYVEVQHVADHEDPALSDSGYASNIIFGCPTYTLIDTGASRSFVSLVERLVESGSILRVSTS
jgi:hypothetical protein